jgi:hypothetical protein
MVDVELDIKESVAFIGSKLEACSRIILLFVLSIAALIFVYYQVQAITFQYPLDYGEAPLIDQAMRLILRDNIYRPDISSPPFTITNYPPIFVTLLSPFVQFFGPNFWAGRVISSLSALVTSASLALIVFHHTKDRFSSLVTGLVFLAFPYVVGWSSLSRIDLLALALSTLGLFIFSRWPHSRWTINVGGSFLVLAIFTRQSYALAAPFAAFVWLWSHKWKRAIHLTIFVGIISALSFLILNLLSENGFTFNIITANVNEFGLERLKDHLSNLADNFPFLLLVGSLMLLLSPQRTAVGWFLAPYLFGAFLSALTIGKIGSNINYFLELCAALSLSIGAMIAWLRKIQNPAGVWIRTFFLLVLCWQIIMMTQISINEGDAGHEYRSDRIEEVHKIFDIVANSEGPVLADEYMGMITLQGRSLYIQPFEVTQLANAGIWDQTSLLEGIRNKKFPLILLHYFGGYDGALKERWTPEMLSAISANYYLYGKYAETHVLKPVIPMTGTLSSPVKCPGAHWRLPTQGDIGVKWKDGYLDFLGWGNEGEVPVYAVADGLLSRRTDWIDTLVIKHEDPKNSGEGLWSYYSHMVTSNGKTSYIHPDFPPGSVDIPVHSGQLIGYQSRWGGRPLQATWLHLHFALLKNSELPVSFEEINPERLINPAVYFGINLNTNGNLPVQSLECE